MKKYYVLTTPQFDRLLKGSAVQEGGGCTSSNHDDSEQQGGAIDIDAEMRLPQLLRLKQGIDNTLTKRKRKKKGAIDPDTEFMEMKQMRDSFQKMYDWFKKRPAGDAAQPKPTEIKIEPKVREAVVNPSTAISLAENVKSFPDKRAKKRKPRSRKSLIPLLINRRSVSAERNKSPAPTKTQKRSWSPDGRERAGVSPRKTRKMTKQTGSPVTWHTLESQKKLGKLPNRV